MLIQLTGLSGSGKSTIAKLVKKKLELLQVPVEVLDADNFRQTLCKDLGYSKKDRDENISRLAQVAASLQQEKKVVIIAAINPYEDTRKSISKKYGSKTVWIKCPLEVVIERDTKGYYQKALLADDHPEKLYQFTGINDPYDIPTSADLVIETGSDTSAQASDKLVSFIMNHLSS